MNFDVEEESVLDMSHREVSSQDLGINGSAFLAKIEEYFKVMIERDEDFKIKEYSLETGQIEVIEWALKNGYFFRNNEEREVFELISRGGECEKYVIVNIGDEELEAKKLFQGYLFERRVYEEEKEEIEKDYSLAEKYCLRFSLLKEI